MFIQAVDEIRIEKTMSYLDSIHINKIYNCYKKFKDEKNFSKVIDKDEILKDDNARLSVQLFVKEKTIELDTFEENYSNWKNNFESIKKTMSDVFKEFK